VSLPREKRIIPISSGKGGVGKTTVAINLALGLSRHAPTLLIDLDMGTSSVRNCIDTPVEHDLYHFFKKGHALTDCVTMLEPRLDPKGEFKNFGFVAAPRHMIEDITNFDRNRREHLIEAINALPVPFVILDLKAGLDNYVTDFLPYSNSGILVFTPHLPSATMAAADIVKAILFRKLRIIFAPDSAVYSGLGTIKPDFINSLIDRVEDAYDTAVHNLDAFVFDLQHALGDSPVATLVANAVDTFSVHFVLNMFNGIRESYETAIKPFSQSLAENVSAHLAIENVGWVLAHEKIAESNIKRVPALLTREDRPVVAKKDAVSDELARLASLYRAPKTSMPRKGKAAQKPPVPSAVHYLDGQLDVLRRMHEDLKGIGYRENFHYLAYRVLHLIGAGRPSDFGDTRLFKQVELQRALMRRGR
jgi:MinD-like ATPase involved in chromosome partitioning or flagellar assembly